MTDWTARERQIIESKDAAADFEYIEPYEWRDGQWRYNPVLAEMQELDAEDTIDIDRYVDQAMRTIVNDKTSCEARRRNLLVNAALDRVAVSTPQ